MINSNLISNISINKKLTILFITVVLGFIATSATYWFIVNKARESTERTNLFIEYGQLVSEAQKNYFKVRRFEKDFILSISASTGQTYNNAPIEEHAKHIQLLEENMEQLRAVGGKIDANVTDKVVIDETEMPEEYLTELVSQASTVVNDYKSSFSDIVKFNQIVGFTGSDGLRLKANDSLNVIAENSKPSANANLLTSVGKLRSHEKQILQSIDLTESFEDLKSEAKIFSRELQGSKLSTKERFSLDNKINNYVSLVNEIVNNKRSAIEYTELFDFMLGPMFEEMSQSSKISIGQNQIALEKDTVATTIIVSILLLAIAALISTLLYFFGDSIRKPINKLLDTIHEVNDGNLSARVQSDNKDELGELSTSFDQLLDEKVAQLSESEKENEQLNESVIELIKAVAQLGQKDFTVKVPVAEDVTGAVGDSLNLLTKETAGALNDVKSISKYVAGVSRLVQKQSALVTSVAENERNQVEKTVGALNQSSHAMNKISEDAIDANERADNALQNTQSALDAVNLSVEGINSIRDTISETEKRIKRLGERSQEITGIVNLINSIAERTHILALNASMHAASAGEAGRGFAVVADEVQRLAESAREATTEIGSLVSNIRTETNDTVTAMNKAISQVANGTQLAEQAGSAMKLTEKSTEDLVKAVERITQSSKDQAKVSLGLVEKSKDIVLSTHKTEKYLKTQVKSSNNLVVYSKRLLATIQSFKLPETDTSSKDKSFKNIDVPEIETVLKDQVSDSNSSGIRAASAN